MTNISVVSPIYGCRTCLYELYYRLTESLAKISSDYEIILVNDASPDGAWETIVEIAQKDNRVKGINLSRNFGQHYAITAGLAHCKGEWVVVMDCDLQDKPEEIIKLYKKALEGYHSVFGQRILRNDKLYKRLFSRIFYNVFSYLTDTKQDPSVANFGIYHKKVIEAVLDMKDQLRYFPTMVQWVGFNKAYIEIEHQERVNGKSSYNFSKLFQLATNIIIAFSDKPLRLMIRIGFFVSLLSLVLGLVYFIKYLSGEIVVTGFASLIISIWFLSGLLISLIGIVGLYIGKMFEKVKNRPVFIINDVFNI